MGRTYFKSFQEVIVSNFFGNYLDFPTQDQDGIKKKPRRKKFL